MKMLHTKETKYQMLKQLWDEIVLFSFYAACIAIFIGLILLSQTHFVYVMR